MQTVHLADVGAVVAPDGSQIRELVAVAQGSMVHCTLPQDAVSMAVVHATVDEAWYCLSGTGQVWRRCEGAESILDVEAGIALTIECGTHFQFHNTGDEDLCFVIVTMPPWPGAEEARRVEDYWVPPPVSVRMRYAWAGSRTMPGWPSAVTTVDACPRRC